MEEREDGTTLIAYGPPVGLDTADNDAVQTALRRLLPKADVLAVSGYQWNEDPYSKGTWAFYRPGQVTHGLREMQAEGPIFFANSDIANGWRGFVDGAIESALTAAPRFASISTNRLESPCRTSGLQPLARAWRSSSWMLHELTELCSALDAAVSNPNAHFAIGWKEAHRIQQARTCMASWAATLAVQADSATAQP
jgi:hypothetical protein